LREKLVGSKPRYVFIPYYGREGGHGIDRMMGHNMVKVPQLEYLGKEGGRKDNKDTGLKMPHLSN
jgi:hypothetical protein